VNDLERDLREVFHDDALRVPTPATAPEGLRRSARRRQAVFGGAIALAGLAVVAGVVAGATTLLSRQTAPEPGALGPKATGTMNGVTITYPEAWHLIDPETAGLNGPGSMGESPLPRIVLALAPTDATETFGCPGQVGGESASTSLMTIQEEPPAVNGQTTTPWPVELGPMEIDASESGCYPGWTFERAVWSASGRTFDARIGFAADASDEEHDAMVAAFASMTFAAVSGSPSSVVLDSAAIGGETYQLIATAGPDGLELTLRTASSAGGASSGTTNSEHLLLLSQDVGGTRLVFGAVPAEAIKVVRTDPISSTRAEYPVVDVPDEIDPAADAFLAVGGQGSTFEALDASGNVVARGTLGVEEEPSLDDGRHFGYVRSVDPDGLSIEFDLAYFLSGQEADVAYQAAGGTGHVPNDHFVVNDNPKLRTLSLAPDLRLRLLDWNRCCDTFFDGDLSAFALAIREQRDVIDSGPVRIFRIYRGQSQWWITVREGIVTQIEEQYAP
jgi:hypothetical protein